MNNAVKLLAAGLFASVIANIYFVGSYIGQRDSSLSHKVLMRTHEPKHIARFSMRQLTRGLPEAVRQKISEAMREQRDVLHAMSKEQRTLRKRVIKILDAEEVDIAALREIFKQQRNLTGEIQAPAHKALLKILPTIDRETRQSMIKQMQIKLNEERDKRRKLHRTRKNEPDQRHKGNQQ